MKQMYAWILNHQKRFNTQKESLRNKKINHLKDLLVK